MASVVFPTDGCDPAPIAAVLRAARLVFRPPATVRRTRFDTFDGRIHAAQLRLELAITPTTTTTTTTTGGAVPAQLVLGGADGVPAQLAVVADPSVPIDLAGLPSGPLHQRLATLAGGRALLPQVTLTATRRTGERRTDQGAPRLRVHLDTQLDTEIDVTPSAPAPTSAIEVVALPGGERAAAKLGRALERLGLTPQPGDALELAADAAGVDRAGWSGLAAVELDRTAPALVGFRAALRACADGFDANLDGTVHAFDSEFLHDLRISVRRTRSLLTEGRKVLPADVRGELREGSAWLGALTSDARDLDVYVEGWPTLTAGVGDDRAALEPLFGRLVADRVAARAHLARELRSSRATDLRARERAWLDLPDAEVAGGAQADRPLGVVVAARMRRAHRRLLDDGRAIGPTSPPTDLHQLRKDAKRLRYLLESFGALGGRRRQREVVRHLKRLQDNLGEFQDAQVQADRLRLTLQELAADAPPVTVAAVDRLTGVMEWRQQQARAAFEERFAAYDRPAAHRTMDDLLDRMSR